MLNITSSVTPNDVSQLPHYDVNSRYDDVMSASRPDYDIMTRRTPGWGKRLTDMVIPLEPVSRHADVVTSKRRGWGKRLSDNMCGYYQSLLHFIEVSEAT